MKIMCKVAGGNCPRSLTICCGICEHLKNCMESCDSDDLHTPEQCADSEIVADEMIQFQSAAPEAIQKLTQLVVMKKQMEEQEKLLKVELLKAMEAYSVKSFENEQIKLTYVAPTTKTTINSTKLKKDHPDIAKEYSKVSPVSASVRITVK